MQFGIQTFVVRRNVQHTGTLFITVNVHGLSGIKSPIIFMQFLAVHHFGSCRIQFHGFIDSCHMGTGNGIHRTVCQDHIGTCCRGIHIRCGSFRIVRATLIDLVKNNRRCHAAGNVHVVKYQSHHGFRILFGIFSQIHRNLACRKFTADLISTGLGDMYHRMRIRFCLFVLVVLVALSIGKILAGLIIYNIVGSIYRCIFICTDALSVYSDSVVRKHNGNRIAVRHLRCLFYPALCTAACQNHDRA